MTPIETGQSDAAAYEHPLDDRAVVVPEPSLGLKSPYVIIDELVAEGKMTPEEGQQEKLDVCAAIFGHDSGFPTVTVSRAGFEILEKSCAELRAVLKRAQAILAEGLATSQSTTARGGPLALGQAAKLALEEINASGVLT